MINRTQKINITQSLVKGLAILFLLMICGCGDFFAEKPTEIQSRNIIRKLSELREVADLNTPLPDIYLAEPKIIKYKNGAKVFYFTKHHTVDKLSGLIEEQLGFKVSQNPATNQLIINCPSVEAAGTTIDFLNEIDVPPIQIKIDCLISEIYADVTMDWETTIKIENLLGEKISLGGKEENIFSPAGDLLTDALGNPLKNLLPAFPGASLRDAARSRLGLKAGYVRNQGVAGHEFRAVVDMLVSRGYLKILMNPQLEVVNGRTAKIKTSDHVPLPKEVLRGDIIYQTTEYVDVIDSLEITPHAFADGSIGLETKAVIGSKSTPEGVKQISIITKREINIEENRIRPGDSLVIGGIKKTEKRSVVRGVPFLKDIPIIGILFSSKDFEERAKEIIFIITPSISKGGVQHAKVIKDLKKKHAKPKYKTGLQKVLTDPFGKGAYLEHIEQKVAQAEFERLKSDIEKAEAQEEIVLVKEKLLNAAEDILAEKEKVSKAQAELRRAWKEAKKEIKEAQIKAEKARLKIAKAKIEKDN